MHKTYEVHFKALPDTDDNVGRFTALVSVFGNVDSMGDRVIPGAFKGSLERWRAAGDAIPVIWSHDWGNPFAHIGSIDPSKAIETDEGLLVEGEIDLTNAFAAQVHNLMKRRMVKEFSFGYRVIGERPAKDGANELTELDIIEAGPTLKGANPATELLGVKADLESAARRDIIQELAERVTALEAAAAAAVEPAPADDDAVSDATSQEPEEATDQEQEEKAADPTVAALQDLIAKMGLEA
jgi:HK97 family phage prohead protease